jgi:hypothetical protein
MWISIIIKIIVSLIIIITGHQIWNWMKDNYSTKKTKDLVGSQIQKYKTILQDIQDKEKKKDTEHNLQDSISCSQIVEYKSLEYQDLKNDLEIFLKEIQ